MFVVLLCLILLDVGSIGQSVSIAGCPDVQDPSQMRAFENKCYQFVLTQKYEFHVAERYCVEKGGYLAMPKTKQINDFMVSTLRNSFYYNGEVWIGLDDRRDENVFKWADGTTLLYNTHYTNWKSNNGHLADSFFQHSYEDCVVLDSRDGLWHDYHCENDFLGMFHDYSRRFICEYKRIQQTTTPKPTTTESPTPPTTTTTPLPPPTTSQPTTTPEPTTIPPTTTPIPAPTTPEPTVPTTTPEPTTIPPATTTTQVPAPTTPEPTVPTTTPEPTTTPPATTTTPIPATTTPEPTVPTTTPDPTRIPPATTTTQVPAPTTPEPTSPPTTACPPFICDLDCGMTGYIVDAATGCTICECDE